MLEKLVTLGFLIFSCIFTAEAHEYLFGTFKSPQSGFLPTIAGWVAITLATFLLVGQLLQKHIISTGEINWRKCIYAMGGLFLYIMLLNITGYIIATFVALLFWIKVAETEGWAKPYFISSGTALILYAVFVKFLGVNFP